MNYKNGDKVVIKDLKLLEGQEGILVRFDKYLDWVVRVGNKQYFLSERWLEGKK